MRLIDADALRDRLQNLAYDDWNQGINTTLADSYREVANMLDDFPTIEEQKHGHWIDNVCCSECDWVNEVEDGYLGPIKGFKFCPNCGADMR